MNFMCLYSLSVLRVNIAERDGVAGVVASEEKPITEEINMEITDASKYINKKNTVKTCIVGSSR